LTPRAYCLDSIRLFASLALAIGHLSTDKVLPDPIGELLLSGISSALFFIMSGYAVVASPKFWTRPAFATSTKRAMRLLPPHWFAFAMMIPIATLGASHISGSELLYSLPWWLSGLHAFIPLDSISIRWNPPAWAITPLLLGGLTLPWIKLARLKSWPLSPLVGLLITLLVVRIAIDLLQTTPANFNESFPRHSSVPPRLLEIYAGGLAATIMLNSAASRFSRALSWDLTLIATVVLTTVILLAAHWANGMPAVFTYTHGPFLPIGLLLVASAYLNLGRLSKLCSRPWLVFGGHISIYVWLLHIPVTAILKRIAYRINLSVESFDTLPFLVLSLLSTILAASICYKLSQMLRSRASTAQPTPETPAPATT